MGLASLWAVSESKTGISQAGPRRYPGGTGAAPPTGESPRGNALPAPPCAGPTAPQGSRTSQTTGRAAKRLYAALRAKPGHPSRRPGWAGAGTGGAGADPPGSSPRPPPCRPDGPPLLPHVHRRREGGKTPVRASGSKIGISKPQGPPRKRQCVNPGLNPGPPAAPDQAEPGRSKS